MNKAAVSLDLDNLWAYLKASGEKLGGEHPSYLHELLPEILDELDRFGLNITFFLVGYDADQKENHPLFREIVERGHEVGSHSYHHEPWLHLYSKEELEKELSRAHRAIIAATGVEPVGFRGPGFSHSPALLQLLKRMGYQYDSSLLPTFIGPLARMVYFMSTKLSKKERKERKKLYGSIKNGFYSSVPFNWDIGIQELPVTTIPWLKLPIHMSYLHFLDGISSALRRGYLTTALTLCRWNKTPVNFLLHPTDFFGADRIPQLRFFPGMTTSTSLKRKALQEVLGKIKHGHELVQLSQLA